MLVSGFVMGFALNDVRRWFPEKFGKAFWFLLKHWLNTLLDVNSVGSFRLSEIANSDCFGGLLWIIVKKRELLNSRL